MKVSTDFLWYLHFKVADFWVSIPVPEIFLNEFIKIVSNPNYMDLV